jgi:replicative DNA helicase
MSDDRPLPENLDAERSVLGAILVLADGAVNILDYLAADEFHSRAHQEIFAAMRRLHERRAPIDLISVGEELRREDKLEVANGHAYIASLTDGIPRIANNESYARIIKEKARLRELIFAADWIKETAYEGPDAASLLDQAIESVSVIARRIEEHTDETTTFRNASAQLLDELSKGAGLRIYTGVDELDRLTGGFCPGELVLFTAETGTGKTLLAQQTRQRACSDGHHGLYASGEMLAPHLVSREIATAADVDHYKMRRPDCLTHEDLRALLNAMGEQCDKCRILDGELTLARIRRAARQMKSRGELGVAVLDYDELIDAPGKDEFEQQKNLIRGAKSLAMELSIPVIVISQLRKSLQGEDRKRPTLQRLYGSGAKPKHSSIVIYVDRPFVQELHGDETQAKIIVLKNRDGRLRALDATFNVRALRFDSLPATPLRSGEVDR